MNIISLVNQKGGVSKTTSTHNIGAALSELGKKVLLVDLDPQGNLTSGTGIVKMDLDKCETTEKVPKYLRELTNLSVLF